MPTIRIWRIRQHHIRPLPNHRQPILVVTHRVDQVGADVQLQHKYAVASIGYGLPRDTAHSGRFSITVTAE